jgi:hypothetical protein
MGVWVSVYVWQGGSGSLSPGLDTSPGATRGSVVVRRGWLTHVQRPRARDPTVLLAAHLPTWSCRLTPRW